jgi:tRNA G18 (ribose-2'-O)-methylase SpoU
MLRVARVEDAGDARLADYRNLKDAELRRGGGVFVAESQLVVRRLLGAGRFRLHSVLLTERALESLREALEGAGDDLAVYLADEGVLRAVVGFNFHRGCVAVAERGAEPTSAALLEAWRAGPRLVLVLDRMTNPDNVGGVFRNAVAFAADGVLLSPGCCDPLYRKVIRVSMGGSLEVPFARVPDLGAALTRLRADGFTLLALTPGPEAVELGEMGEPRAIPARTAVLLGAEMDGLAPAARAAADLALRIAMAPGVDSLNVATACGIALHRLSRGRLSTETRAPTSGYGARSSTARTGHPSGG